MKTLASLFAPNPDRWGLRGDPHLWWAMLSMFADVEMPTDRAALEAIVRRAFMEITGHSFDETENFFVEHLAHGGMSSGYVSPEFWKEKGLPLLLERFDRERDGEAGDSAL